MFNRPIVAWFGFACILVLMTGCRRDPVTNGMRALERGDARLAETFLKQAIELDPTDASAFANLGLTLERLDQTNAALTAFRQAADLAPDDPRPLEFMAAAAAEAGQWKAAADLLSEAVRRTPRSPRTLTALAVAELQIAGPQAARVRLEQTLQIAPNYSPAVFNLAVLKRDWLKDPADARKLFQRYLKIGRDPERVALARAALTESAAAKEPSEHGGTTAIPPAASLAATSPHPHADPAPVAPAPVVRHPQAAAEAYNQGVRSHSAGDLDHALQEYRRALQNDPGMANAYYNIGLVYRSKGDPGQARTALQQALTLAPDLTDAHYMLALVLRDLHESDAAITELTRLIGKSPGYAPAHHALGLLYKSDPAKLELAKREFSRYLELAPNGPSARESRTWLKSIP